MNKLIKLTVLSICVSGAAALCQAQNPVKPPPTGILYDGRDGRPVVANGCKTELVDVTGGKALKVTFSPTGQKSTAAQIIGPWDLTGYTGIEAKITNVGKASAQISIRADNPGPVVNKPWNMAVAYNGVAPGETITLRIDFGFNNFRDKVTSYPLDPSHIGQILLAVGSPGEELIFRLDSLKAVKAAAPAQDQNSKPLILG